MIFLGLAQIATMALTTTVATTEGLLLRYFAPEGRGVLEALTSRFFTVVLPAAITYTFLFLLYWMGPRQVTTLRHAALGALLATTLWEAAKAGFSYYVRNLARFVGLYGALEGVIVLALWLELSVSIIFYCGEVVALSLRRDSEDAGKSLPRSGFAAVPARRRKLSEIHGPPPAPPSYNFAGREGETVATLIEAFSAVLLSLGSYMILRTLWKLDIPPSRAVGVRRTDESRLRSYRRAA